MEYPVNISFRCAADMERRVRIEAAKRDMNRTEFILEALREKLRRIDAEGDQIKFNDENLSQVQEDQASVAVL